MRRASNQIDASTPQVKPGAGCCRKRTANEDFKRKMMTSVSDNAQTPASAKTPAPRKTTPPAASGQISSVTPHPAASAAGRLLLLSCCAPCACAVIKSFMKTARISPWRFTIRTFTPPPNIKSAAMNKSSSAQLGTFRSRNSPTTLKTGFKPPCPIKTSLNAAPAAPSVLSYA